MLRERLAAGLRSVLIALTASFLISCSKASDQTKTSELEPRPEANVTATPQIPQFLQPVASPSPTPPPAAPPPKLEEVRAAMSRVFGSVATPEAIIAPLAGDFNGDGSTDLAVTTKASAGSLKVINDELANWVLEDPRTVPIPGTNAANQMNPQKPIRVEAGDTLVAIIHGVGTQGWRSRDAKQTYLLKNAAAGENMSVVSLKDATSNNKAKLPPLRGDTIRQTLNGKPGFLFWTGAKYSWYQSPE